jgi:hypothetical protein
MINYNQAGSLEEKEIYFNDLSADIEITLTMIL